MNLIDKAFLLKKTQLFSSLDLEELLTIADKLEELSLSPDQTVPQDGQRLFIVASGTLLINDTTYGPNTFFGDRPLFHPSASAPKATTQTAATLLTLSRPHLLTIITECPSVALSLLEIYAKN